jgi:hypothetical protein
MAVMRHRLLQLHLLQLLVPSELREDRPLRRPDAAVLSNHKRLVVAGLDLNQQEEHLTHLW